MILEQSSPLRIGNARQLEWLIRLRWCAVGLQSILILLGQLLHLTLPTAWLWALIGLLGVSNILLQSFSNELASRRAWIGGILSFDTCLLTGLLALSGGAANPFSIVYVIHVCIAALLLGSTWTWFMVVLTTINFGLLFQWYIPVPELSHHHMQEGSIFSVHLYGMLFAFLLISVLIGFFLSRMSDVIREGEKKITLLQSQQEKLAALTTLSAGAAHELGTPLATIALIAGELKLQLKKYECSEPLIEDAHIISNEVERCGAIIERMRFHGGDLQGEMMKTITSRELYAAVLSDLEEKFQKKLTFDFEPHFNCFVPPNSFFQSIQALIKNSLDETNEATAVGIIGKINNGWVHIVVHDDGKGMSSEVLQNVGNPFFTTKEPGRGMGLGVFLVKLFATKLNGFLEFESTVGKGTKALLSFPCQQEVIL